MSWITRHFGKSQKHKAATTNRSKSARQAKKSPPKKTNPSYRAVTVYSRVECCEAAQRLDGQKFLAAHAPRLPLGGCTQPDTCQCRYRHLQDRRSVVRRDTDHGLPARSYAEAERRNRRDRRRRQNNQQALAS